MDCRIFNRQLEDYLQGEMDFPRRFGMERHARQCYGCGKQLADAQKISGMVQGLERVSAPEDFETAVMSRIQTEKIRRRSWRLWELWVFGWESISWRSLALVSTTLALVVIGSLLYYNRSHNAQPESQIGMEDTTPAVRDELSQSSFDPAPQRSVQSNNLGTAHLQLFDYYQSGDYYDEWPPVSIDPDTEGWIEIPVLGPSGVDLYRLPKTLRIKYGQPSEDYFIRNVSH